MEINIIPLRWGASGYYWYFAPSLSNSAGVALAIKKMNPDLKVEKVEHVDSRLLVADIKIKCNPYKLIVVYVPNVLYQRNDFLANVKAYVDPGKTILMGDFNAALDNLDWISGLVNSSMPKFHHLLEFAMCEEP